MQTNSMDYVREYPHGDIKIFGKDGNLKKIVPIAEAMEISDKEFKKKKPFGFQKKKQTKEK